MWTFVTGMSEKLSVNPASLLEGYQVLEWVLEDQPQLVQIAVAFAGRLLADLGASVTRVSSSQDPLALLRSDSGETLTSTSLLATYLHRGKLNLGSAEVDAVIDSVSVAMLGSSQLLADQTGTLARIEVGAQPKGKGIDDVVVSELGIQGLVGLTDLFGEPDQQPLMMGGHQTAYATGFSVFCAAVAAIAKQRLQGETDSARVNAVDALAWVNWKGIVAGTLGFPVVRGGRKAEAPVLKCVDGYFAFLHMPNNWKDILQTVGDPRLEEERFSKPGWRAKNASALNEILRDWAKSQTKASLFEFCQRCAIPGGPVMDGADLLKDPLYLHRDYFETASYPQQGVDTTDIMLPGLPLTVESAAPAGSREESEAPASTKIPGLRTALLNCGTAQPAGLPLAGTLVLDLGIFTAGSVTSTLLADLGARVIKVESASYSDPFRIWPGIQGDSPLFTFNNRNKLGVNLDLKTPEGKARFLELVAQADVVVENFRRGVLERLGIDFPGLQAANPEISLVSISGQGASGPGSGHVSFGSTLEALGGVAALTGYPDGPCYISGRNLNYPDQIVCLYGAGTAIAALLKAKEQGTGVHIDVSQREVTTLAVGEKVAVASCAARAESQTADFPGNTDINASLQDIFAVTDGWLCVTAETKTQLEALAALLGCETADVSTGLADWLGSRTSNDATAQLRVLGLAVFKANTGAEAAQELAIASGPVFAKTASGAMVKGFPFQFIKAPLQIYEESPSMGEHTEAVVQLLENS